MALQTLHNGTFPGGEKKVMPARKLQVNILRQLEICSKIETKEFAGKRLERIMGILGCMYCPVADGHYTTGCPELDRLLGEKK